MFHVAPDSKLHLGPLPNHSPDHKAKLTVEELSFWYGDKRALKDISLAIYTNEITALLGPSGCGKSTLLRCLNRTNEFLGDTRMEGRVLLDGSDIYGPELDPPLVRQRFGWIAQRPDPFPRSIRYNMLYGSWIRGMVSRRDEEDALVESCLRAVGLWDETKDRLKEAARALSIGQQQRLCIARAIATRPEVLLMDEPCSALDPVSTGVIESLIEQLRLNHTIVIITHNIQQAARIAQRIAFFHLGEMQEVGDAEQMIVNPQSVQCRNFITGRYG